MKKYTLTEITEKLSTREITLIGEYQGYDTRTKFRCRHGHIWEAVPKKVINGSDCLTCAKRPNLVLEDINQRIRKFGLTIDSYTTMHDETTVRCDKGHVRIDKPKNLKGKCKECVDEERLTVLLDRKITLLDDMNKLILRDKYNFSCDRGHIWNARLDHLLDGVGCPSCSEYGFNKDKSAWLYVLKFDTYGKYGITNNLDRRLAELCRVMRAELLYVKHYEKGIDALNSENQIKKTFGGRYVTEEICPDGWTETVPIDSLIHIINTLK